MNRIHSCLVISLLSILTGCLNIQMKEPTLQDKQRIIASAARASTSVAITQINKKDAAKQVEIANKLIKHIDQNVFPVINNTGVTLLSSIEGKLMNEIPQEYRALMTLALDTFHAYFVVPDVNIDVILTETQRALIKSFAEGIRAGAQDVLIINKI